MDLGSRANQFELNACLEYDSLAIAASPTSAEFLSTALRQARVGTWQVDMQTGLSTWDSVTSEILGLPAAPRAAGELLPVHSEDRGRVLERLEHRAVNGGTGDIEFRISRPDGDVRWLRATGRRLDAPQHAGRYVAGIVSDVTVQRAAAESLREAEERYRLVSEVTADLIFDWDIVNDRVGWNEARGMFLGYTFDELGSMIALQRKIHPDDQARVVEEFRQAFDSDVTRYTSEHRFVGSGGNYADVHARGCIIRDPSGRPVRVIGSLQDVTERRYADAALRESEAVNRGIVEASTDSVVLLDLEGRLLFLNKPRGISTITQSVAAYYGQHWTLIWPPHARPKVYDALNIAAEGGTAQFTQNLSLDGQGHWWEVIVSPILNESGRPIKLVAIARDITQRREADEKLRRAATYDSLTNLPNRAFFQHQLAESVEAVRTNGGRLGLLLLDVDDFKQVNDSLGHDAGDALLKSFAARLELPAERRGVVARLGGDEFAVLLHDIRDEAELNARTHAIMEAIKEPLVHAGRVLDCHATIGAALCPEHGSTPDQLLKSADIALYAAKESRRGSSMTFHPSHRDAMQKRISMVSLARNALRDDLILPYYQPKLALSDKSVHGFEALLRWRHPTRGVQLPATISAAFEDLEVATAISERIIDQVIGDIRTWLDQGVSFGHVAVNAAAAEFRSDSFAESVLERLRRAGVPTNCFHLEVTETVFLGKGAEYVDRALKLLDREGVRIALDDFGTGYASLRHLKQFPVHEIKIDQSFVQGMTTDADNASIIAAVLNLGHSLNIDVVAEGIETKDQERRLRELGCDYGQGFLYSEAVSAGSVRDLLETWERRVSEIQR
jgi:diguanylate cyclase (GGDEF)-like protein/PAS domain S-box-containing protein